LPEIRKSERLASDVDERTADRDVAQYLRSERRLADRNRERIEIRLREALLAGTFIFRGKPTPVRQEAETLEAASRSVLAKVAGEVFNQYHLVTIRPRTNLAAQFLEVERMDRMPRDRDPLGLVVTKGGAPRIDVNHSALAETLRAFRVRADDAGGGRLTGKSVQDFFANVPYGWSKDAVRYLFAALLVAGEIEVHTGGQVLKTSGPAAVEVFKSTVAFNKVGIGLRDSRVSNEVLDQAARCLQSLFGEQVLPLEDNISRAARKHLAGFLEDAGALPDRLRLLQLPGEERAQTLIGELSDLLKGDASDAPSRFGVLDSSIPADIEWARAATRVLDQSGEQDIRRARALLDNLAEIVRLFPEQRDALATKEEVETLQTVLNSERFHEQLADIRGIVSTARRRCRAVYVLELAQYRATLDDIQTTLENRADWVLLSDADRAEIVSQLETTLPETPTEANLLADFRALLMRSSGLARLQNELEARIERLAPDVEQDPETIEEFATRRLDEKEAELAESQKLKYLGAMASAMAHGLNQPIGVIRAVSSASLSDFQSGLLSLEETEPRFRKIMTQTDRLAHIIDNMRAFARGDWQKREKVDLRQVVAQMCEMFADQFESRSIELHCSGAHVESALAVWANPVQLQEVLINLLTNARDAVEGQHDASVRVDCWRLDNGYCGFAVEDNGPGLPSEYREQIFTPFVTTKPSEKGTGLGLYTSWRMIDALGGQLRHEDKPDRGARFVVELPPMSED